MCYKVVSVLYSETFFFEMSSSILESRMKFIAIIYFAFQSEQNLFILQYIGKYKTLRTKKQDS